MNTQISTRDKLLQAGRELFWTRGYSNVSVRDITGAAGVDAALVSRYFGGKQGLFEATLEQIPPWDALAAHPDELLEKAVDSFSEPYNPQTDQVNPFTMLMTNVIDPVMGDTVRALVEQGLAAPLAAQIGQQDAEKRAATLLAVLFGVALMRKNFQLKALADLPSADLRALLLRLGQQALHPKT